MSSDTYSSVGNNAVQAARETAQAARDTARSVSADVRDGVERVGHAVGTNGRDAKARLEVAVQDNPLLAIGIAAAAGYLFGMLRSR